jgi:hypothetical protein
MYWKWCERCAPVRISERGPVNVPECIVYYGHFCTTLNGMSVDPVSRMFFIHSQVISTHYTSRVLYWFQGMVQYFYDQGRPKLLSRALFSVNSSETVI